MKHIRDMIAGITAPILCLLFQGGLCFLPFLAVLALTYLLKWGTQ